MDKETREAEWAETKQLYAQPDSPIDIGYMYWWATYWHGQSQASRADLIAKLQSEEMVERVAEKIKNECYVVVAQHYEHPMVATLNEDGTATIIIDKSKPKILVSVTEHSLDDGMCCAAAKAAIKAIVEGL